MYVTAQIDGVINVAIKLIPIAIKYPNCFAPRIVSDDWSIEFMIIIKGNHILSIVTTKIIVAIITEINVLFFIYSTLRFYSIYADL
jgi:hypothetical protein